jgi:hypothetical protein
MALYLTRPEAAKYIRETYGIKCSAKWLAKLAVTGGGPLYWKNGRAVLYRINSLDAWVHNRLRGPWSSSTRRESAEKYFRDIKGLAFIDVDELDNTAIVPFDPTINLN